MDSSQDSIPKLFLNALGPCDKPAASSRHGPLVSGKPSSFEDRRCPVYRMMRDCRSANEDRTESPCSSYHVPQVPVQDRARAQGDRGLISPV